jgi:hypothetical protein
MLDGYFAFVEAHRDSTFIHWNMRDENYGFAALEHRYRVLGGVRLTILPLLHVPYHEFITSEGVMNRMAFRKALNLAVKIERSGGKSRNSFASVSDENAVRFPL